MASDEEPSGPYGHLSEFQGKKLHHLMRRVAESGEVSARLGRLHYLGVEDFDVSWDGVQVALSHPILTAAVYKQHAANMKTLLEFMDEIEAAFNEGESGATK